MLPSECVIKEVFANTQLYRMIICKLCTYRSLHCPKVSKKKMKVEESKLVACYVLLRLLLAFSGAHSRILNSDNIFLAKCSLGVALSSYVSMYTEHLVPLTFCHRTFFIHFSHLLHRLFSRSHCRFLARSSLRSVPCHLRRNDGEIKKRFFAAVSPVCIQTPLFSMHYIAFFFLRGWVASSTALQDLMQTQSFILLNARELHAYSARENTASAKKMRVAWEWTIFASELKVTCCSLSRSRAALPLNGTRSLASPERPSGKGKVLS